MFSSNIWKFRYIASTSSLSASAKQGSRTSITCGRETGLKLSNEPLAIFPKPKLLPRPPPPAPPAVSQRDVKSVSFVICCHCHLSSQSCHLAFAVPGTFLADDHHVCRRWSPWSPRRGIHSRRRPRSSARKDRHPDRWRASCLASNHTRALGGTPDAVGAMR